MLGELDKKIPVLADKLQKQLAKLRKITWKTCKEKLRENKSVKKMFQKTFGKKSFEVCENPRIH